MDDCFKACPSCSCDETFNITKSDWDRFTDKVDNVLNHTKGRELFRSFMRTNNLKDGLELLDFWELIVKILDVSEEKRVRKMKRLIHKAERIEELDMDIILKLDEAYESDNKEEIEKVLILLKMETIKLFRCEYRIFRDYLLKERLKLVK